MPSTSSTQAGGGFAVGKTFVLKHSSGKCIASVDGVYLVLTSRCDSVFALFTQLESGLLKNLWTCSCVSHGELVAWGTLLELSSNCENTAWRVQMTSKSYLTMGEGGSHCVHPHGGSLFPEENTMVVLHPSCGGSTKLVYTVEGEITMQFFECIT